MQEHYRPWLWAGIIGPIGFFVVFTIEGALTPGYSAIRDAVSYLALGAYGWVQELNFVVLGTLLIVFAYGFSGWWRSVDRSTLLRAGGLLIGLSGFGYLLAATFPANRPPQPPGSLHTLAFEVVFFGEGFACLVVGLRLIGLPGWRFIGWLSIVIAICTVGPALGNLGSLVSAAPQTPISSPNGAFPLGGLFNRIVVAIAFLWYVVISVRMLRSRASFPAP